MKRKRTRLTVELESETEPIRGQISEPGGRSHEFSGYMGLIETFERLRPPVEPVPAPGDAGAGMRVERKGQR
jgi:hypothetical protein